MNLVWSPIEGMTVHGGYSRDYPTLRFDITNVFDTVYEIRNGTGIGVGVPQFGPRRGFFVGLCVPF